MAADQIPTIVLAMGAAVVGGPDALRFLLGVAGKSPAVDVAICVFAITMAVAPALGTMLLARYVRRAGVARDNAGAEGTAGSSAAPCAPGAELFQKMVQMVAVAVALVIAACLLAAPAGSVEVGAGHCLCWS